MPSCKRCGAYTVWDKKHHEETGRWVQFDPNTGQPHNYSNSVHESVPQSTTEESSTITITTAELDKIVSKHYKDILIEIRNISRISQKATLVLDKVDQALEQSRIADAKVDRLLAAFTNGKWVNTNTNADV
jgi:hypothetical protein